MRKRLLAIVAAMAMVMTMIPAVAFAGTPVNSEAELQDAVNAGGDITIGNDFSVTGTIEIPAGKTVTIDLNGHTISGVCTSTTEADSYGKLIHVANTADLTIKDSASNGKITYDAGGSISGAAIWVEGNLTLESGTIEVTGWDKDGFAVDLRPNAWGTAYTEGASFVMDGGNVSSSDIGVRVSDNSNTEGRLPVDFTMNNGEVTGAKAVHVQKLSETKFVDDLSVTINGGTLTATHTNNPLALYVYNNAAGNTKIAVDGGVFDGYLGFLTNATLPVENVSITDGEFNSEYGLYTWDTNYADGFRVISGGTFVVDVSYYVVDGYEWDRKTGNVVCCHEGGFETVNKDATCTEDGYKGAQKCNTCSEIVEPGEVIPATGHTYKDGVCVCGEKEPVDSTTPTTPADTTKPADSPKTGDDFNAAVPMALAGLAAAAMAAVVLTRKRQGQK